MASNPDVGRPALRSRCRGEDGYSVGADARPHRCRWQHGRGHGDAARVGGRGGEEGGRDRGLRLLVGGTARRAGQPPHPLDDARISGRSRMGGDREKEQPETFSAQLTPVWFAVLSRDGGTRTRAQIQSPVKTPCDLV